MPTIFFKSSCTLLSVCQTVTYCLRSGTGSVLWRLFVSSSSSRPPGPLLLRASTRSVLAEVLGLLTATGQVCFCSVHVYMQAPLCVVCVHAYEHVRCVWPASGGNADSIWACVVCSFTRPPSIVSRFWDERSVCGWVPMREQGNDNEHE
jgi:hypothetical protein